MDLNRFNMKKLLLLIAFAGVCLAAAMRLEAVGDILKGAVGMLSPFIVGAAIAFILNVPMRFFERVLFSHPKVQKCISAPLRRGISLLLTFASVAAVIAVLLLVIIPQLSETIIDLGETVSAFVVRAIAWGQEKFANNPDFIAWLNSLTIRWDSVNWEGIINKLVAFLRSSAEDLLVSTISVTKGLFSFVASAFISIVFCCYLLLQKEKLALQVRKVFFAMLPKKTARRIIEVFSLSQRVFSNFITGQCVEAIILGLLFFITMLIFRMPYALLVGCLISVTALVPIVGAFVGCGLGAFLILMVSPAKALFFVVMFLILQQIEGNLIYPHVVGSSVGLPSIWVLAAVSIGGSLMGVAGMLIFIPLTSVLYSLFREYIYGKLKEKHIKVK